MKHALIWIFILSLGWTTPALAQTDVTAPAMQMLQNEGYRISEVRHTWLGRILIVAKKGAVLREVVLNRRSGAILNDQIFGGDAGVSLGGATASGPGNHGPDHGSGPGGSPGGGSGPGGPGGDSPGGGGPGPGGL